MAPQDYIGRIHKQAFVGSSSAILGLTLIGVIARLTIRLVVQKQFAADDAVLIIGLCTLIAAFVILYTQVIDRMYVIIALQSRLPGFAPPGSITEIMYMGSEWHKWVTVTLMLSWCSIMAAKLSILAFFWKLIDRIRFMKIYWLGVFIFNLGVLGYGVSIFILACPYFYDPRELQCNSGIGKQRLLTHSITQTSFDILGDLFILYIPINIIWRIRIRLAQKVALLLSLGLTAFMVVVTIIRVSGLVKGGLVDTIWEVYWLFLGGEIGIFLASAIAFRSFFITRAQSKNSTPPRRELRFFSSTFARKFRRRSVSQLDSGDEQGLPGIPGAQLTGMRTFIDQEGKSILDRSQHSKSTWRMSDVEDGIPLRSYGCSAK
ncbi:hypothetical protein K458DRAFT_381119 [Lentithecium fluviatile CBS 122367]|uniref:Rhodopsin domain-containing protein n=1 Tax=Lentithecium fluviatile CBS 122367 TaxID=1168545 RepID=A0A6G1IBS2_9PLEO|nr:hypothetical protein K458DRAFT_381119 [Lentithecium fluviatile CBS 122367]